MTAKRARDKYGLTKRQAAFCVNYVANGGNGTQAAIEAGYGEKGAHVRASEMLRQSFILSGIDRETKTYIKKLGAKAIGVLAELMVSAHSETVRNACAVDLANRAGYKLPQVVELQDKTTSQELDNRIAELLRQLSDSLDPAILQALQTVGMDTEDHATH